MKHLVPVALLGLAVLTAPTRSAAVPPPQEGPFPASVLHALRAHPTTPSRDPGGAPLLTERVAAGIPLPGSQALQVAVLPVDFPNLPHTAGPQSLDSLFFRPRAQGPGTGSASEYYHDVSLGNLVLGGGVLPWYRARLNLSYYASVSHGLEGDPLGGSAAGLLMEALRAIDSVTDFSPYDADGDGFVDAVCLLHGGAGAETSPRDTVLRLWSHERSLTDWGLLPYRTRTPWAGHPGEYLRINKYIMVPELNGQDPGKLNGIGSFCHELGHVLGLPDLYDIQNPLAPGVGNWDLMAGGVFGGDGHHVETPSQMGAFSRAALGWVPVERVTAEGPVRISPTENLPRTLQLWSDGRSSPEYLLLENRARIGWDRYLPGQGLLIWHVDDALVSQGALPSNSVDRGTTWGVRVYEADGLDQMYQGVNRGDDGDPFPGSGKKHDLDGSTNPAALDNQGGDPHVSVRGIRLNADSTVDAYLGFTPDRWLPGQDLPAGAGVPNLSPPPAQSVAAAPRGTLHLVWTATTPAGLHVFHMAKSLGLKWDPTPLQLDQGQSAYSPTVAVNSRGDVTAVWIQQTAGRTQLASRRRPAGGTWEPAGVIREGANITAPPSLVTDSKGVFYCAWAEKPDTSRLEHVYCLTATSTGWSGHAEGIQEDSSATDPSLIVDNTDQVHLLYFRRSGTRNSVYHSIHVPAIGGWYPSDGPLTPAVTPQPLCVAAEDSGRVTFGWRETRGSGDGLFLRRWWGNSWDPPQGPMVQSLQSTWPVSLLTDPSFTRSLTLWEADEGATPRIRYQEIEVNGPSDASTHVLAGSDSSGAAQPTAVWDSNGNLDVFWVEGGRIRMRARQGLPAPNKPPQIVPLTGGLMYLGANWPNPMAPHTRIPFEVPPAPTAGPAGAGAGSPPATQPRSVRLAVYDVSGRLVKVLTDGPRASGRYEIEWDGTSANGARTSSGVYFYRLDLGMGLVETRKLLLLR